MITTVDHSKGYSFLGDCKSCTFPIVITKAESALVQGTFGPGARFGFQSGPRSENGQMLHHVRRPVVNT